MKLLIILLSFTTLAFAADPEWPIEYVTVHKEAYKRNTHASFCIRPPEMVDTIVIHHTETPSGESAQGINRLHLNRGTPQNPWYMIAYSYIVHAPYPKESLPKIKVTEGRPFDLVGAHAGSNAFAEMDEVQAQLWKEGKVVCGKEGEEFKVDETVIRDGKIKANVTTLGLVVVGNYSPMILTNPSGYPANKPRYATAELKDLVAKFACQLQRKYPRIKKIKWHNYYHDTTCPGNIVESIDQIKALTREYGCEFN